MIVDEAKQELDTALAAYDGYNMISRKLIRTVAAMIPAIGGPLDKLFEVINSELTNQYEKKIIQFFEAIISSDENIAWDNVKDEKVIQELLLTMQTVNKLTRGGKIEWAAKLFKNTFLRKDKKILQSDLDCEWDEYEEWLDIIVSCSQRELVLLLKIYKAKLSIKQNPMEEFSRLICGLKEEPLFSQAKQADIYVLLKRLESKGLLEMQQKPRDNIYSPIKSIYYPTQYFCKLANRLEE